MFLPIFPTPRVDSRAGAPGSTADTLAQAGFGPLRHLAGDMPGWVSAGLPVEKAAADTPR